MILDAKTQVHWEEVILPNLPPGIVQQATLDTFPETTEVGHDPDMPSIMYYTLHEEDHVIALRNPPVWLLYRVLTHPHIVQLLTKEAKKNK